MMEIIAIIIAYLLGSISVAVIVCKVADLPDPRTEGSGNPGASNVLRVAGKHYAAIVLLGDALKGFCAVVIAMILGVHGWMLGLISVVAVLGHMFPVFFKFKGGKGVATAMGCYFALSLPLGIVHFALRVACFAGNDDCSTFCHSTVSTALFHRACLRCAAGDMAPRW